MENLDLKDSYLASSRINWRPYFECFIEKTQNGTKMDYDWKGNLENGAVEILKLGDIAASDTQIKINSIISEIKSGNLKVFDTSKFTVSKDTPNLEVDSNKYITSYKADVDSDENYTGDAEVVSDEYFHESEKRISSYFDLRIDEINEIFDEKGETENFNSTYRTKKSNDGLSTGAICAIDIPCVFALLVSAILAFTLGKKDSHNIQNVSLDGVYNSSINRVI